MKSLVKNTIFILALFGLSFGTGYASDDKKVEELLRKKKEIERQINELTRSSSEQSSDKENKTLGEKILVTATRFPTPVEEIGRSHTLITRKDIEKAGRGDVLEILRSIKSLQIVQTGGKGGTAQVFTRGSENNHTKFLVNGYEMNSDGGSFDLDNLVTDDIERIEVIRGPGSSLYGSTASAGVINIITKKGRGQPRLDVSVASGSYGTTKETMQLSGSKDDYDYALTLSHYDKPRGRYENTDYTNTTFSSNIGLRPSRDLELRLTTRVVEDELGTGFSSAGPRFEPQDPNDRSTEDHSLYGIEATMQLTPKWESHVKYSRFDEDVEFRTNIDIEPAAWPPFLFDTSTSIFSTTFQRNSFLWHNRYEVNENYKLIAGYDFNDESGRNSSNTITFSRKTDGYFLRNQFTFIKDLTIGLEGRFDESRAYKDQFSSHFNAVYNHKRAGTVYRVNAGNSFKAPSFSEIQGVITTFGITTSGLSSQGKPTVEKVVGWDVGADQKLGDWGQLAVTYFENHSRNLVESINRQFQHSGKIRARGWELGLELDLHERVKFTSSWTLMSSRVSDTAHASGSNAGLEFDIGNKLIRRPNTWGTVALDIAATDNLDFNITNHYVGEYDDRDWRGVDFVTVSVPKRVEVSDHHKTDASVLYRFDSVKGLKFFGTVENLLDDDYDESFGFPGEKVNFLAGFSFAKTF